MKELTQKKVESMLKTLDKEWPDNLWLFSASGTLHLMQMGTDGHPVFAQRGGVDPEYIIMTFSKIGNDGGDWTRLTRRSTHAQSRNSDQKPAR